MFGSCPVQRRPSYLIRQFFSTAVQKTKKYELDFLMEFKGGIWTVLSLRGSPQGCLRSRFYYFKLISRQKSHICKLLQCYRITTIGTKRFWPHWRCSPWLCCSIGVPRSPLNVMRYVHELWSVESFSVSGLGYTGLQFKAWAHSLAGRKRWSLQYNLRDSLTEIGPEKTSVKYNSA